MSVRLGSHDGTDKVSRSGMYGSGMYGHDVDQRLMDDSENILGTTDMKS